MDFSTPSRALESIPRRKPALPTELVQWAQTMLSNKNLTEDYVQGCLTFLEKSERWEILAVGVYLCTDLLTNYSRSSTIYVDGPRVPTTISGENAAVSSLSHDLAMAISRALLDTSSKNLEHKEPRIRTLVAKAVGAVIALNDESLQEATEELYNSILSSLYTHLEAGRDESSELYSKSSTGALDDTTGWRALETNWQGLAAFIAASGPTYFEHHQLTEKLLEACEYCCITHLNRHVRAAGIATIEQWIKACSTSEVHSSLILEPESPLRRTVVKVLKVSLADNWSQVRMAASVLCRVLWQCLLQYPIEDRHVESIYPTLIPRMCLNRFYLAQGVKLYSHETWMIIFGQGGGLEAVASNAGAVCRYYVKMCDADNHAVREAACQAVAELAQKLGSHPTFAENLQPYVATLLQALIMCFHDESWPVRDEACLACGRFCRAYPEECRSELPLLKERWLEQLTDQIWSVREDAAVALGDAMLAYPRELEPVLLKFLKDKLPAARDQPAMTREEYIKHSNDIDAHTEQQLYSCGSLAPKLRKGGAGRIGCSSCGITRPKAAWEATDGCIYLMREIVQLCSEEQSNRVELEDDTLLPLIEEMVDVCRMKHFPQSDDLRATLFRQLPVIARALGKQRFKRVYLQLFLDIIMDTLDSRTASALSKHAAGQCCEELGELVGAGIFRGRLDDYQQEVYDKAMQERRNLPKGPVTDGMSPFGPKGLILSTIHPAVTQLQGVEGTPS
eukprot:CAMPEP_0194227694 /NCGR_PEP_ID=MMETSP0156-20130528/42990_1 /TAXON_ID=33649 /ORGANISM="Thalassionema nitzschioides, Strain L26-B" /LENGTH=735 /DNA_ID=CAMNT_0038960187 /DNA_START=82 /DNA_END=2289 /DNA_ORIENTATION=-